MNQTPAGGLPRRDLLRGLGAIGAAAIGAAACGRARTPDAPSGGGKKLELTMFVFLGGDLAKMPKEFAAEWESSHANVRIKFYEESNQVGYPKMAAQKKTNPDSPLVDLGFFNAQTTEQGIIDQMWAPLDYAAMPNAGDVREGLKRSDRFGIGVGIDPIGMLYNTGKLPQAPQSWAALWDPANRGKVVFFGFPWYAVFMAAKAGGGSERDMEPGWRTWQAQAKNIRTLVTSNNQYLNAMSTGTGVLTAYFNGTGNQWVRGGAPLRWVPPQEGAIAIPVILQAVASADQDRVAASQEIINEMLSPRWNRRWAETSIEVPANQKVELPADLAALPAFAPENVAKFIPVDYSVVGRNNTAWTDRWNREIASRI